MWVSLGRNLEYDQAPQAPKCLEIFFSTSLIEFALEAKWMERDLVWENLKIVTESRTEMAWKGFESSSNPKS